jgi:hypothetical protein
VQPLPPQRTRALLGLVQPQVGQCIHVHHGLLRPPRRCGGGVAGCPVGRRRDGHGRTPGRLTTRARRRRRRRPVATASHADR